MTLQQKLFWVSVLYFSQGFPFGLVLDNLPVYFRVHGVSLTEIGLMSLLQAPWFLKVLWAPLVDRFGTRQQWIVSCLVVMTVAIWIVPFSPASRTDRMALGRLVDLHPGVGDAGRGHRCVHHRPHRQR